METCKSPRTVIRTAHALAVRLFKDHTSKFSRKDYTLPQLFACLVLREHQKKSYRGVEALLLDCSDLREDIGLARAPDHNTLCRAFKHLIKPKKIAKALDLLTRDAQEQGLPLCDDIKPAAIDSTYLESHHVSRHVEKRREETRKADAANPRKKRGETVAATAAGRASSDGCRSSRSR